MALQIQIKAIDKYNKTKIEKHSQWNENPFTDITIIYI